jgi:Fic family protein
MASFFLKIPLPELLPSIDFSKLDLESFTKSMLVVAKDTVNQIDNYLEQNSSMDQKTELWKRLTERREQLKASLQSVNSPLMNTTA